MKRSCLALLLSLFLLTTAHSLSIAASSPFPKAAPQPKVADFLPSPAHTYYCSPAGSNSTGNGSIDNPWLDLIGASGRVAPGDLIYFRGGNYPAYAYVNFSRSQNILSVDGTASAPIVLTNYPGEIAIWDDDAIWSMTLDGDYQKLIGTRVGSAYGIKFVGGLSVRANNVQISGVEFAEGTSNGGDLNPAMLSVPLNDGCDRLVISHNYFHDSVHKSTANRMAGIRMFRNSNLVVEHNLFKDMRELSDCAAMYFKDNTKNATVRNNTFINVLDGVEYVTQDFVGGGHYGIHIYENLFYAVDQSINFRNEWAGDTRVYNNVALAIPTGGAFFYYLGANPNGVGNDYGEVYDNVIDGTACEAGWHANSVLGLYIPNYFDYNLWYRASDRNSPGSWDTSGYYAHAVTAAGAVHYDPATMTATVDDNYPGIGEGRYGGTIGGFTWGAAVVQPPQNLKIVSMR